MRFQFDTAEEYDQVRGAVHDAILYWKKVKQDAEGAPYRVLVFCHQRLVGGQVAFEHVFDSGVHFEPILADETRHVSDKQRLQSSAG